MALDKRKDKMPNAIHLERASFMKSLSCFVLLLVGLLLVQPAYSEDTNSVAELQQQVQKLKAENESLKQENQVLRKLVFEKQNTPQPTVQPQPLTQKTPAPSFQQPAPSQTAAQGYWMTTSSHKRHNSSCRYYGTTNGRPCSKDEGIACKICGG